jgi:hypothetical protein
MLLCRANLRGLGGGGLQYVLLHGLVDITYSMLAFSSFTQGVSKPHCQSAC